MPSRGQIKLNRILKALDVCLEGYRCEEGKHRWHIYPPGGGDKFYLPQGEHGAGSRAEIKKGQVKCMARQFDIEECMKGQLDGL